MKDVESVRLKKSICLYSIQYEMCDVFFFVVALDLPVGDYYILCKPILMAVHSETGLQLLCCWGHGFKPAEGLDVCLMCFLCVM